MPEAVQRCPGRAQPALVTEAISKAWSPVEIRLQAPRCSRRIWQAVARRLASAGVGALVTLRLFREKLKS